MYTDNWYTKLPLARELLTRNTFLTGTVNKNTKDLSINVKNKKLGVEQSVYYRYKHGKILLVKYKQKATRKPVFLISSGCHAEDRLITSKHGLKAVKPIMINNYNLNMGGVDNSDKSLYHLSVSRPTKKYWKRIFSNLLDIILFDAYILYCQNTDKPMSRTDFHSNIVEELVDEGQQAVANLVPEPGNNAHGLEHLPGRKDRVCVICVEDPTVKRKKSVYWCPGCNCGIHPLCYKKLKHFWRPTRAGRKRKASTTDESD